MGGKWLWAASALPHASLRCGLLRSNISPPTATRRRVRVSMTTRPNSGQAGPRPCQFVQGAAISEGPWMGGHFGGNKAQRSEPCRRGATETRPQRHRGKMPLPQPTVARMAGSYGLFVRIVERFIIDCEGRFVHGFRETRVRVYGALNVLGAGRKFHREYSFCD